MNRNLALWYRQLLRRPYSPALSLALLSLAVACGDAGRATPDTPAKVPPAGESSPALGAGEAYLPVPDGRIWYKRTGTGTGTPVILLHGGPGYNSFYLKSLEALGDDRPVIRYDQLGGGKSGPMTDTSQMTIAHFVRELDSLRIALGYARVHILGHSWGTILGFEYYRAHPEHVASLTMASAALDIPAWERNARRLVRTLSDSAQEAIRVREAERKFDAPDYQRALEEFYGKYVWRHPPEADLDSTMKLANQDIYGYMQGPSEFTITGTLKSYDVTPLLGTIKVPTLYTVGEFDEADPPTIRRFASLTPGAAVEVIPGAAHITTWDNPEAMLRVVRRFLRKVDARQPRAAS
jgi:proline iminopeptidase